MWTNVQFTGSLVPGASNRWFSWGWPVAWHVVWYMMVTSPQAGAPQVDWDVAVERANATQCTYWITVKNLTANNAAFEARYAVLN
jgi:hypothetical protein